MSNRLFNTRTGRNKEQTIKAYSLLLTIIRQRHDQGLPISTKDIAKKLHVSTSISLRDLPHDLYDAPYEVVTSLDYVRQWLDNYLRPLRKSRKQATEQAKVETDNEPLVGIFEKDSRPLADILTDIERATHTFIAQMEAEITKAKQLINN